MPESRSCSRLARCKRNIEERHASAILFDEIHARCRGLFMCETYLIKRGTWEVDLYSEGSCIQMVMGRTLTTSGAVHDSASSYRLLSYCICFFYFLGRLLPGPGVGITDATHGNQYKSTSFKSRSVYTHTCTLKHARNKKMIDI